MAGARLRLHGKKLLVRPSPLPGRALGGGSVPGGQRLSKGAVASCPRQPTRCTQTTTWPSAPPCSAIPPQSSQCFSLSFSLLRCFSPGRGCFDQLAIGTTYRPQKIGHCGKGQATRPPEMWHLERRIPSLSVCLRLITGCVAAPLDVAAGGHTPRLRGIGIGFAVRISAPDHRLTPHDAVSLDNRIAPRHRAGAPDYGTAIDQAAAPDHRLSPNDRTPPYHGAAPHGR